MTDALSEPPARSVRVLLADDQSMVREAPAALLGLEEDIEVVAQVACGDAEVGRRLLLSEGTVRNHLSTAIQKTGARNRAEAVRIAREKGWLQGARSATGWLIGHVYNPTGFWAVI